MFFILLMLFPKRIAKTQVHPFLSQQSRPLTNSLKNIREIMKILVNFTWRVTLFLKEQSLVMLKC